MFVRILPPFPFLARRKCSLPDNAILRGQREPIEFITVNGTKRDLPIVLHAAAVVFLFESSFLTNSIFLTCIECSLIRLSGLR